MSNRQGFELIEHYRALKRKRVAERLGVSTKLFESTELEEDLDEATEYGYDAKQEVGHDAAQGKQKPMQSIDDPKDGTAAAPNVVKKGGNKHKEAGMLEEEEELEQVRRRGSRLQRQDLDRSEKDLYGGGDSPVRKKPKDRHGRIGENNSAGTVYGDDAKQEVGHDAAQGKQKPMQSIDEPASKVGHRGPKVAKQGPNKHKEDSIKEGYDDAALYADVPEGASWEDTRAHLEKAYNFYKNRSGRLNQSLAKTMERALRLHMQAKGEDGDVGGEPGMSAPLNESVNKLLRSISKFRKQRGDK